VGAAGGGAGGGAGEPSCCSRPRFAPVEAILKR